MKRTQLPFLAILLAVGITTYMDFNGLFDFSALPLFALTLLFWIIGRQTRSELGLRWGSLKHYGEALLHPLFALTACALFASMQPGFLEESVDWPKMTKNIAIFIAAGWLMTLITEEGFFRGWLWAAIATGKNDQKIPLITTSIFFVIWHISAVTSGTDYGLPFWQIPIYLVNVMLLGLIWGLMRWRSGSILVPTLAHAVWNPLAYELFGTGTQPGALGAENTWIYGPEVGLLGILFNGLFCWWLWKRLKQNEH